MVGIPGPLLYRLSGPGVRVCVHDDDDDEDGGGAGGGGRQASGEAKRARRNRGVGYSSASRPARRPSKSH